MTEYSPAVHTANGPAQHENSPPTAAGTPILMQYWQKIARWKWVILGIVVCALAAGVLVTLLTTPQYTANVRLEISREQQSVTDVEGLETGQTAQDDEFYQTQYSNLRARSLAERVARQLRLAGSAELFEAHGVPVGESMLTGDANGIGSDSEERLRMAVDLLLEHIAIDPIPRSRLVTVSYTSSSPSLSATIANTWAEQFIAMSIDRRFESTAEAREFLEGRLVELGQRLEESERAAVAFANANNIYTLAQSETADGRTRVERTLVTDDLEALNAALAAATSERIAAESRVSNQGATTESTTSASVSNLQQRKAEAEAAYAQLMVQFEPGYPRARELQQQINTLDRAIEQELTRIRAARQNAFVEARKREQGLSGRVEALKQQLTEQQRDQIQYNVFQREADTNRELYDSLLQRYKEIGVAGVAVSNIAIVDLAEQPNEPSSPNLLLNLALAFVAGIGISFIAVVALEQIDEGLRDPTSVREKLGLPLLGAIPAADKGEDVFELSADPKSEMHEAYTSVQSNLAFATNHGFPRSLMVTSARPSEGKTTSSIALATALGRTGKKVLLIDCDLRLPACHRAFGLDNKVGVSNVLVGDKSLDEVIRETSSLGLSLISSGPLPPSAGELLSSDSFRNLVRTAAERFDHVVVDAPPLLGLADAPLISRTVEGVVFVSQSNYVPARRIRDALNRLHQAQARVFGVIMTKVDMSRSSDSYGYEYGYGSKRSI